MSGRAHQISRATARMALAPPHWRPSECRNRSSRNNSWRGMPNSALTRGSCNGATAKPRRVKMGSSQRAKRVQNPHSASKNSQPLACLPFPSVYSLASEIMLAPVLLAIAIYLESLAQPAFFFSLPSSVITFPRSLPTPFSAPTGIRRTSSNSPVMVVRKSSMLSSRSRVYASPGGPFFNSCTHSASARSVGSISRRLRSSATVRKISQTSLVVSKWSRRSPRTCTTRTMPHPCNSRRLVLTFERATDNVAEISSAGTGCGERKSKACTWATVRLMPHLVPISPQWRMNFCATGVSVVFVVSVISVCTEYTVRTGACQALFSFFPTGGFCLNQAHFGDNGHQLRHVNPDDRSLPFVAFDLQVKIVAIKHVEPLADVTEPYALDVDMRQFLFADAHAIVLNFDLQATVAVVGAQLDLAAFQPGRQAVLDAVLHNGLQQHAGDKRLQRIGADLLHDIQVVVAKARHLNVEIIVNKRKLFTERHKRFVLAQQSPEYIAEFQDHAARRVRVNADQRRNRVERVEKKVRVDLAGERVHPGAQQQLLVALQVHLDARVVPNLKRRRHAHQRAQHHHAQHPVPVRVNGK